MSTSTTRHATKKEEIAILTRFVDDILLRGGCEKLVDALKRELMARYGMKDMG